MRIKIHHRDDSGMGYDFFMGDNAADFQTTIKGFGSGFLFDVLTGRNTIDFLQLGTKSAYLSLGGGLAINKYRFKENIVFSHAKLSRTQLNWLYNIADVQILITSNEGWGLTLTEAMLAGNPIIANVTGGMQDQMRFEDEDGKWFTPSPKVPSNNTGKYKKHGEWAFPVYPTSRSIQGSIQTPYIYDDRCSWEDAVERIKEIYNLSPEERKARGLKGREWAVGNEAGFTSLHQANRVIEAFNELFSTWKPREKYEITNATKFTGRTLKHKLIF